MWPARSFLPVTTAAAIVLSAADGVPRREAPRINTGGIVNAASSLPAPDNFVSPGAIVSIYGTGFSNETREVRPGDLSGVFLPDTLAGVSVFFGPVPGPLFYVSPQQINAQVPFTLQPGDWDVKVRFQNLEAAERAVVRPYSPGLFSVLRHADGTVVSRDAPARPGEVVMLFGTGFGSTRPQTHTGEVAPPGPTWLDAKIAAKIGEMPLALDDILYWGLASGFAGLYQFNLRVPAAAPSGDLEVMVKVGDDWSQAGVRIPVAR